MLKSVQLHLETDEQQQQQNEALLAEHITTTLHQNINAFERNIPSLAKRIKQTRNQSISIFSNNIGKYNIVNYGTGRVLYGFDPEGEVQQQYQQFLQHTPYVPLDSDEDSQNPELEAGEVLKDLFSFQKSQGYQPVPAQTDVVVLFGLGLAMHLEWLVQSERFKHIIVYEPEDQYFHCSVMVTDWRGILETAKSKGISLFLQVGRDGRDLLQDIPQLKEHFGFEGFYFYKHYNHPVFDAIQAELIAKSWPQLKERGFTISLQEDKDHYAPPWTYPSALDSLDDVDVTSERFVRNMAAFKHYFPDIHSEFVDYKPKVWLPVVAPNGDINIVQKRSLCSWYGEEPQQESLLALSKFAESPNKDGLVLGYSGKKLRHYLHYQLVAETEELLKTTEEERGELPEVIKAIIVFGLGAGYQVETMVNNHEVEKLFICEPNRDFFYASLFAIDWDGILKTIDKQEGRIYINIGDDGSNLFSDLLAQFHSIGAYVLNNTYFYQGYYNSELNQAIAQLREQLQLMISLGEYFDHAYYGVAHTRYSLDQEYPYLSSQSKQLLSLEDKEVPVFLLGNGPSIDQLLDVVKEWQDHAIIVSCGTVLQVLHRHGIKPDFHAEIEQNRSTFDWATRIGDLDYLSDINLLSCNGIHPDTCSLYGNKYLAFKEGESSTVSALELLGEDNYEVLSQAFPTVTNLALNLFSQMGMRQFYLLGVDLGFISESKHHSSASGYYKDNGDELYSYSERNNIALTLPGNFRSQVYTKQEFKIAKLVMEQGLAAYPVECYNCSDGARINGTTPLQAYNILITSTPEQKTQALKTIKEECFRSVSQSVFAERFAKRFSSEALTQELQQMLDNLSAPAESIAEAETFIEAQKKNLFDSYEKGKSLLFYYLYGTNNYANAVLAKLLYCSQDEELALGKFNQAREIWLRYFERIQATATLPVAFYDGASSFAGSRFITLLKHNVAGQRLTVLTSSQRFATSMALVGEQSGFEIDLVSVQQFATEGEPILPSGQPVIYFEPENDLSKDGDLRQNPRLKTLLNVDVIVMSQSFFTLQQVQQCPDNMLLVQAPDNPDDVVNAPFINDGVRAYLAAINYSHIKELQLLLPKSIVVEKQQAAVCLAQEDFAGLHAYDGYWFIALTRDLLSGEKMLWPTGSRALYLGTSFKPEQLVMRECSQEEYLASRENALAACPHLAEDDQPYV